MSTDETPKTIASVLKPFLCAYCLEPIGWIDISETHFNRIFCKNCATRVRERNER